MAIIGLILLGLALGSFINAAVWRLHEHEQAAVMKGKKKAPVAANKNLSIVTGRSLCTHCGHQLAARDLVPVVSYVLLRGRCRYCGKAIEDTPLAELALPILFVVSYLWWPYNLAMVYGLGTVTFAIWLAVLVGFVFLAVYDLKWFLLPDKIVFPLIAVAALDVFLQAVAFGGGLGVVTDALWGIVFIAGIFYILYLISRGTWIGFGDVKLAVALGLLVGGPLNALLVMFLASLLGSAIALPLIFRGKAHAKTRLPFGPLLIAGTVIVMLFGTPIIDWYKLLLGLR